MKKFVTTCLLLVIFFAYALLSKKKDAVLPQSQSTSSGGNASQESPSQEQLSPAAPVQTGTYKDGTYTGPTVDAFYGNIQVQATIQSGRLTDVQFLQYPNDRGESIEINQNAMPQLREEAIQAQNAQVDIVTGATDSSRAFVASLTSALSQAQ